MTIDPAIDLKRSPKRILRGIDENGRAGEGGVHRR
jgi:hypothetical protein